MNDRESLRVNFSEADRLFKESAQDVKQIDDRIARIKEETIQLQKENEQTRKEIEQLQKETAKQMKETDRQIGALSNRFGELAEHLVAPSITEKFNALGFNLDYVSQNHRITNHKTGDLVTEVDLLLENSDTVIAVEIKAKPGQKDVDEHVNRMDILRRRADARQDRRRFRGAIAGAIMHKEVRDYAHKTGFYVIEQTGDTVKINLPKSFTPREW